jgi:hypothetical protein
VILALPLQPRTPDVAMWAPQLAKVRYLRTEPMISLDLFFKKTLSGLPNGHHGAAGFAMRNELLR